MMGEDASRGKRRVSEVVEKGVEGLYDFLLRLMNTFWLVSFDRRACRSLISDRHGSRARYVLPFTYAAVGIFLISLVAGVAGYRILDWIWFYQEISETVVQRLREGVSFLAIAAGSVPAFIFMLALSAALARLLEPEFGRSGRAMFVTCYAIGTQSIFLFLAAVLISLGQVLPGGVGESKAEGAIGEVLGWAVAILLIAFLLCALAVPVLFFIRSFNKRRKRLARAGRLLAYILISGTSIWALPFIAALPTLLAAAVSPALEPKLTIEADPVLRDENGQLVLSVDLLLQNPAGQWFGAASDATSATIRYGNEPLENPSVSSITLGVVRIENEAGQTVGYTSAEGGSLTWRRAFFKPAESEQAVLAQIATGEAARCIQVRFGSAGNEVESVCVRRTIVAPAPDPDPSP